MRAGRVLTLGCVAAAAVALAACDSGGGTAAKVAPAKPASAYRIGNLATEPTAPWAGEPGQLRGSASGSGADVTLGVTYRHGKITPPPGLVRLSTHQRLKVAVMSDRRERLMVQGYPQASSTAGEGSPGELNLDVTRPGTFRVTLQPGHVLVAVLKVRR
jgi:hypothetical protein